MPSQEEAMMRPSEDQPYGGMSQGMSQDLSDGLSITSRTNLNGEQQYPPITQPAAQDFAYSRSNPDLVKPGARTASRHHVRLDDSLNEKMGTGSPTRPPMSAQNSARSSPPRGRPTSRGPYGILNDAQTSTDQLAFAPGDYGNGKAGRLYLHLISSNIVVRWVSASLQLAWWKT